MFFTQWEITRLSTCLDASLRASVFSSTTWFWMHCARPNEMLPFKAHWPKTNGIYCQPYLSWSTILDDFPFVKNACIMIESIANGLRILALESSLIPGFVTWVIEVWMWQLLQWISGNFVHTGIFKFEIQIDWYPKGWTRISFQTFINLRVSQIWCGWNLRESPVDVNNSIQSSWVPVKI